MKKQQLHQQIMEALQVDLQAAIAAAQTAHETATHEENSAENKYDTRGLEAAYLAAGHSRRVNDVQAALLAYRNLVLRPYYPDHGIQLSACIRVADSQGKQRAFFLGPAAAGLKIQTQTDEIMVITPKAPLGRAMVGKAEGDEIEINVDGSKQLFKIIHVD
jgi:transcription elongation GreA/GreB family factor